MIASVIVCSVARFLTEHFNINVVVIAQILRCCRHNAFVDAAVGGTIHFSHNQCLILNAARIFDAIFLRADVDRYYIVISLNVARGSVRVYM